MLQGSLDNFSLDEVLGLLASTAKTGSLEVKGNRGLGTLALDSGQLVAANASNTANGIGIEDVVFELLRFTDGNFAFSPGEVEAQSPGRLVPDVLAAAENRLADWRLIEAVVPSLSHIVTPVPTLPADEITIDRREWSTLIVIGSGCPASSVCSELDLGEVEGSRQIKDLADRGLVSIGPPVRTGNGVGNGNGNSNGNGNGAGNGFGNGAGNGFGSGAGLPTTGEHPLANDPFARRPEYATRPVDALTGAAPMVERVNPMAPSVRDLVGAAAGSGNGAGIGHADLHVNGNGNGTGNGNGHDSLHGDVNGNDLTSLPIPAELRGLDRPDSGVPTDGGAQANRQAPPPPPTVQAEPARPGGLLMRYLKGED